jgi:hypothetical protein
LRTLLENVLQQDGRLLAAIEADGASYEEAWDDRRIEEFGRVVGISTTATEAVRQLAGAANQDLLRLEETLDALANRVLRQAWNDVQGDCIAAAESLAQVATSVAALAMHGPDPKKLEAMSAGSSVSIEKLIDAIQAEDAAGVALRIDSDLLPAVGRMRDYLSSVAEAAVT